jgi:hypothetical protein
LPASQMLGEPDRDGRKQSDRPSKHVAGRRAGRSQRSCISAIAHVAATAVLGAHPASAALLQHRLRSPHLFPSLQLSLLCTSQSLASQAHGLAASSRGPTPRCGTGHGAARVGLGPRRLVVCLPAKVEPLCRAACLPAGELLAAGAAFTGRPAANSASLAVPPTEHRSLRWGSTPPASTARPPSTVSAVDVFALSNPETQRLRYCVGARTRARARACAHTHAHT